MSYPRINTPRYAMRAAIAKLDFVLKVKASRGECLVTPRNNLAVWRTQMRITTVKTMQRMQKVLTKK